MPPFESEERALFKFNLRFEDVARRRVRSDVKQPRQKVTLICR